MRSDTVRAAQAPSRPALRMVRVTVTATVPLRVRLPDGAVIPGLPIAGLTYTVGGSGVALLQEPSIPLVFPTA